MLSGGGGGDSSSGRRTKPIKTGVKFVSSLQGAHPQSVSPLEPSDGFHPSPDISAIVLLQLGLQLLPVCIPAPPPLVPQLLLDTPQQRFVPRPESFLFLI